MLYMQRFNALPKLNTYVWVMNRWLSAFVTFSYFQLAINFLHIKQSDPKINNNYRHIGEIECIKLCEPILTSSACRAIFIPPYSMVCMADQLIHISCLRIVRNTRHWSSLPPVADSQLIPDVHPLSLPKWYSMKMGWLACIDLTAATKKLKMKYEFSRRTCRKFMDL